MSESIGCSSYTEENVEIKNRVFMLEGKLPKKLVSVIKSKMPDNLIKQEKRLERNFFQLVSQLAENYLTLPITATQEHFFVSFAYADIFIGKTFEIAFPRNKPKEGVKCKAIIKAILQEHLVIPIDSVGHGHRSVCLIDFPEGIPTIVSQMKEVTGFMRVDLNDEVFLCSKDTWNQWLN